MLINLNSSHQWKVSDKAFKVRNMIFVSCNKYCYMFHMKTSQCIYATIINLQINGYFPHTIKFILIETRSSLHYFTYYCFLKSLLTVFAASYE